MKLRQDCSSGIILLSYVVVLSYCRNSIDMKRNNVLELNLKLQVRAIKQHPPKVCCKVNGCSHFFEAIKINKFWWKRFWIEFNWSDLNFAFEIMMVNAWCQHKTLTTIISVEILFSSCSLFLSFFSLLTVSVSHWFFRYSNNRLLYNVF